jgi:hypothetical protein
VRGLGEVVHLPRWFRVGEGSFGAAEVKRVAARSAAAHIGVGCGAEVAALRLRWSGGRRIWREVPRAGGTAVCTCLIAAALSSVLGVLGTVDIVRIVAAVGRAICASHPRDWVGVPGRLRVAASCSSVIS